MYTKQTGPQAPARAATSLNTTTTPQDAATNHWDMCCQPQRTHSAPTVVRCRQLSPSSGLRMTGRSTAGTRTVAASPQSTCTCMPGQHARRMDDRVSCGAAMIRAVHSTQIQRRQSAEVHGCRLLQCVWVYAVQHPPQLTRSGSCSWRAGRSRQPSDVAAAGACHQSTCSVQPGKSEAQSALCCAAGGAEQGVAVPLGVRAHHVLHQRGAVKLAAVGEELLKQLLLVDQVVLKLHPSCTRTDGARFCQCQRI